LTTAFHLNHVGYKDQKVTIGVSYCRTFI